jgi:membrane protein implicated in regulation of membrane protease activity
MRRMQETGTRQLATAVGERGTVYMDIPAGGTGKVRTVVSGTVSFVDARSADREALKAGTPVRVRRLLDPSTIEVEKATEE